MKYSDTNAPMQCIMKSSSCYKGTTSFTPKGILIHSTGANNPTLKRYVQPCDNDANKEELLKKIGTNPNHNDWNHIDLDAGVNAFIGKLSNGEVTTIQVLPWNYRPWGCYKGSKGSCNNTHIQFEICEDGLTNKTYFNAIYKEMCELVAYLCKKYNIDPFGTVKCGSVANCPTILCHSDSYALGLGSNHADVMHWFPKHGKTMEDVRKDVAALLGKTTPKIEEPKATVSQPKVDVSSTVKNMEFKPRLEQPEKGNKYYVLDDDGGYSKCIRGNTTTGCYIKQLSALPNCVGYAIGRFNEIGGYNKFKYFATGNAEDWYDNAKPLGLKTGTTPKLGAIAVWRKGKVRNGSDGCGHVAIVEKIISSNEIITSESGWSSKKLFWTTTRSKGSDGNWGMKGYVFLGFVYHPDVTETTAKSAKIAEDGVWGPDTTYKLQTYLGTTVDGTISGQKKGCKSVLVACSETSWKFTGTKNGSQCIKALQKIVGAAQDGYCGAETITALQKYLKEEKVYTGVTNGKLDSSTVKALQKFLNAHVK